MAVQSLRYRSIDRAGNVEPSHYLNLSIDRTAPTADALLNGAQGTTGWFAGTVTGSVLGTDSGSGVATTEYRLDGGDWTDSEVAFKITGEGNHTLEMRSGDRAGNTGTASIVVGIDSVKPTVDLPIQSGTVLKETTVLLNITAGDEGSGILTMAYKIDDNAYAPISGGHIYLSGLKDGHHVLTVEVTDGAGNTVVRGAVFEVDTGNGGIGSLGLALIAAIMAAVLVAAGFVLVMRSRKR